MKFGKKNSKNSIFWKSFFYKFLGSSKIESSKCKNLVQRLQFFIVAPDSHQKFAFSRAAAGKKVIYSYPFLEQNARLLLLFALLGMLSAVQRTLPSALPQRYPWSASWPCPQPKNRKKFDKRKGFLRQKTKKLMKNEQNWWNVLRKKSKICIFMEMRFFAFFR